MTNFEDILQAKISRRAFVAGSAAAFAASLLPSRARAGGASFLPTPYAFTDTDADIQTPLAYQNLIKWGDSIGDGLEFGFNNDFIAFMPIDGSSEHGLLCVNHEYTDAKLMFADGAQHHVEEMLAHGHSVVEVQKTDGVWNFLPNSKFNRRFNAYDTRFQISGPAAGQVGNSAIGTVNNCSGGKTPWGTVLVCEENFNEYFKFNDDEYGITQEPRYHWYESDARFTDPAEARKFGWVWEYDPFKPNSTPIKRTALGRFKHESATCARDGKKTVVYMGDDERFEFLYKYVGENLSDGNLYVAKFDEKRVQWLLISPYELPNTRAAAKALGATPMDRCEDIAVHPFTGEVFISCSNNHLRLETNSANPRSLNIHGHIIKLMPAYHGQLEHDWDIFALGDENFSCPDNLTFDNKGRLWVCTDGMAKTTGKNDGLFVIDTSLSTRETPTPELVLRVPNGAESTGAEFTPDGKTLFLSIQHPGEGSSFENPSTRWPEFAKLQPPKPAVIAISI